MSDPKDPLVQFSKALVSRVEAGKDAVAAIRLGHGRHVTALVWQSGVVVASEQTLPRQEEFELVTPGGSVMTAKLAGRDPSTNIAILKPAGSIAAPAIAAGEPQTAPAAHASESCRRCSSADYRRFAKAWAA